MNFRRQRGRFSQRHPVASLHYSNGRNDNTLTYELQTAAAERSLGVASGASRGAKRSPEEWMRLLFPPESPYPQPPAAALHRAKTSGMTADFFANVSLAAAAQRALWRPAKPNCRLPCATALLEVVDEPGCFPTRARDLRACSREAARTGIPLSRESGTRHIFYILKHPEAAPEKLSK